MKTEEKISRRERRFKERTQEQASEISSSLAETFLLYFSTTNDPEGEGVTKLMNQIDSQWRTFCSTKQLTPAAYPHMRQYMESVVKNYLATKNKVENPNEEKDTQEEGSQAEAGEASTTAAAIVQP
jgi:putative protein kinase ArgK-like GTPase of G3E family